MPPVPDTVAQPANCAPAVPDHRVQAVVAHSVAEAQRQYPQLQAHQIALMLVDLREPGKARCGSHQGGAQFYPASVVKLLYLAAAHRWLEDGNLTDTPELRRALRDMIVHSCNEATHYVLDLLTGTTSGPELPDQEIKAWFEKRNAVNRYFTSLGYTGVNANQKPWGEGPYGRETQAIQLFEPKRNALTTDATARLMTEIVTGKCVSADRCAEMMALLERDPFSKEEAGDSQSQFTGSALPEGAKLWSKAGWTSQTRHDCAYVELADGRKFVLVTFTTDHASEHGILQVIARKVVEELK